MSIVGLWSRQMTKDLKAVETRLQNGFPDLELNKYARSFPDDGPKHLTAFMHIAFRDPSFAGEGVPCGISNTERKTE